jgi:hypothetical protein
VGSGLRAAPACTSTFNDGQQIYISGRDAEVKQYTTTESRFWAYQERSALDVLHSSAQTPAGVVPVRGVVLGDRHGIALLGVSSRFGCSLQKALPPRGRATSIPYRGWKRWHTIIGLVFGVVTVTWAFSGLLSMGPFDFVERLTGTARNDAKAKAKSEVEAAAWRQHRQRAAGEGRFQLSAYAAKSPTRGLDVTRKLPG